jgi:hypothetical protein
MDDRKYKYNGQAIGHVRTKETIIERVWGEAAER